MYVYDIFEGEFVSEPDVYAPPERYREITTEEAINHLEKSLVPWLKMHSSTKDVASVLLAVMALKGQS